jgi:glycosyltransferase involved in cell wall biosynthesis
MTGETGNGDNVSVSIIVPVFNAANYLQACLDSISRQDFPGAFEVILVDDCSSDTSADICRDWVQGQSRQTRLIEHERNRGVSVARNNGLEAAVGDRIIFVDADDLLPPGALSKLVEAAETTDADIVKGNNTIFDDVRDTAASYNVDKSEVIEGEAILTTLFEHRKLRGHPWGKLFNRAKLGKTRFPEGVRVSEDLVFCSDAFSRANSLLLLNETVYKYRRNESGSAAKKYQTGAYIDWLDSIESMARFCRCPAHRRAYRDLLVRTITQIAREVRNLPAEEAASMLQPIEQRRQRWGIRLFEMICRDRLGLRALSRYIKMQLALRQIRRRLG